MSDIETLAREVADLKRLVTAPRGQSSQDRRDEARALSRELRRRIDLDLRGLPPHKHAAVVAAITESNALKERVAAFLDRIAWS